MVLHSVDYNPDRLNSYDFSVAQSNHLLLVSVQVVHRIAISFRFALYFLKRSQKGHFFITYLACMNVVVTPLWTYFL